MIWRKGFKIVSLFKYANFEENYPNLVALFTQLWLNFQTNWMKSGRHRWQGSFATMPLRSRNFSPWPYSSLMQSKPRSTPQGCQMLFLHTKIPNWNLVHWRALEMDNSPWNGQQLYILGTVILCILWSFGIFLAIWYIFPFWYVSNLAISRAASHFTFWGWEGLPVYIYFPIDRHIYIHMYPCVSLVTLFPFIKLT
jgi:hypothetical protein